MRKQILLTLLVALSVSAFAQKSSFGIRGGVTSSGMRGEAANNLKDLLDFSNGMITTGKNTGFFGGGYVSIPLSAAVNFEPALYYAQKGYELKGALNLKGLDFLGVNARANLNTHYIDLPLLVKANLNGFQVFAGPQVSYLVQADLRTTAGVLGFNLLNRKMDATEQFNRWDAAVTGGVGYRLQNGVNIIASYDHGLSKTDKNKNLNAYNHSFKVGVGYNF
ncbi:MAG TPA: porin family protein [Chitinophagaceae bacterium]|nr:porin family protein [Chitinophagaceae bacterium]